MKNLYVFLLISFIAIWTPIAFSQAPRIYFDTVYASPPAIVTSKIYFENIPDVASLSLMGYYKSSALIYNGMSYYNPVLGSTAVVNISFGQIAIGWFSLNTISFPGSNVFCAIDFNYLQDSSKLSFDPLSGLPFPVTFYPGYVLQCPLNIIPDPAIDTVFMGDTASFSVPPMGHTIFYQWQVSSDGGVTWTNVSNTPPYSGATSSQLNIITQPLMNQNLYRCITSGACTITSFSSALIIKSPTVKGKLTYDNAFSTPLAGCQVYLKQGSQIIAQSNTDANGDYEITDFPFGNYMVEAAIPKPWGGGNSADALLIARHTVGLITLSGLPLLAADVNLSGYVNSSDALMVLKRVIGMISSFLAGDWVAENPTINITAPVIYNVNLKALCTGDVNGSYIP